MQILAWGTMMVDIIAADLPRIAEPGIILYAPKGIEARLGGHPIDVAIDLVQMGIDPKEIGVVSAIGNDIFSKLLEEELKKYAIMDFVERVPVGSGKTLILVVKGEDRRCHLDPGASLHMSIQHLEKVIRETKPLYFTFRPGYTNIDLKLAGMLRRLREAALAHSFLLLDVCAPYQKRWTYVLELIPYLDAVHGNRHEIIRIAGERRFENAAKKLLSKGVKAIFLTKDKEGAEIIMENRRIIQPAYKVKAIEPSGAGDAFCAGIIYGLYKKKKRKIEELNLEELSDVLLIAQAMGAAAVTHVGCVTGVTLENVSQILRQKEDLLAKTRIVEF
jgi:fructokinase